MSFFKSGLIGEDISYSLSPYIHRRICARFGDEVDYRLYSVSAADLSELIPTLTDLDGFNVTKPHKRAIGEFLTGPHPESVNTVVIKGGKMFGHSTDGYGFRGDIKRRFGEVKGTALVLGAGGVAGVIVDELKASGMDVCLANRTEQRGRELAARHGVRFMSRAQVKPDMIVNCTSCGYKAGENPAADDDGKLVISPENVRWVYDTIYSPAETELLKSYPRAARANGLGMLVLQAIEARRIISGYDIGAADEDELYLTLTRECADLLAEREKEQRAETSKGE